MATKKPRDPLNPEAHFNDVERELASFDPAWARAALYFRSNCVWHFGHGPDEIRMRGLFEIRRELQARRRRYEKGNPQELLRAIALCAEENLPLPTWLATAYRERLAAFLKHGGPTSLDDVFSSSKVPKSAARAQQYRRDWRIGVLLWVHVEHVKDKHGGMDPALRAVLKADPTFGVGLTRARELVELIDDVQADLHGTPRLSQFWGKARKRPKSM